MLSFSTPAAVPMMKYGMIMADPPWDYKLRSEKGEAKSPHAHYECLSIEEIAEFPVDLWASGDCVLWLWCTHPMLDQQIKIVDAWGFRFITSGVWRKICPSGKMRWGTGYRLRSTSEPFILGMVGNPQTPRDIPTCFDGVAREHSRKPDEAYALAERMSQTSFRLDMFSRQPRAGWDRFGDQTEHFEEEGSG